MRIYFNSMGLPKKAAKRIQKHFSNPLSPFPPMPLHRAQHIASLMLGYENWYELEQITKSSTHPASPLDEQASPEEQAKRINYQVKVLRDHFPQTEPVLNRLALKFRVSAGAPFSNQFADDTYRQNALCYWDSYEEHPQWRFRPSGRSNETREELYDLFEQWERRYLKLSDFQGQLDRIIENQPENVVPYVYILDAFCDVNDWDKAAQYLPKLEAAIKGSLPPDYPMKKKVPPLIWGIIDNRDYLRGLYYLAQGYYATGNYKKAKQWFLFLTRCSEREIGNEKFFLHDLRQPSPEGDIHHLSGKDICDRYLCPITGLWLHRR